MPKGPQGQRRPTDVAQRAHHVFQIAIGETTEELRPPSGRVRSGHAGGKARAEKLGKEERSAIARAAAAKRWS